MTRERSWPSWWVVLMTLCLALMVTACFTACIQESGSAAVGESCTAHAECASSLLCDCDGTCQPEADADTSCYRDGGPQEDACVTNCLFDDVFGAC